jgi:serine/threonine protein phosphatase 1
MGLTWQSLFGSRRSAAEAARRKASVPDGVVVYAIGDVHGQSLLLENLIAQIQTDAEAHPYDKRILVFVGDYVDRGPSSRLVVERVSQGVAAFETIALKGNHEQILLDFIADAQMWDVYRRLGGVETLMSYGLDYQLLVGPNAAPPAIHEAFVAAFPQPHHDFLRSLHLSYDCGDYHFVHAGVRPGVPLDKQTQDDQLWIRDQFLSAGDVFDGRVIVHGHTPAREPEKLSFRVNVDTGAYMTGRLTAAKFYGPDVQFLHALHA